MPSLQRLSRGLRLAIAWAAMTWLPMAALPPATSTRAAAPAQRTATERQSAAPRVVAVDRVGFTVADLDRSIAFFTDVLDFTLVSRSEHAGELWERHDGAFPLRKQVATLQLGDERVELTEYLAPRGRPIPDDRASTDGAFQHIAIVVADMDLAYQRLRRADVRHVSSEPQTLPAWNVAAGGIEAFYFEDPDGHVLELIAFPAGKGQPRWQDPSVRRDRLFLGIDHTAIGVRESEPALAFLRGGLGLELVGAGENHGPEQARLNAVRGAHLRISTLRPAGGGGPAIELLDYLAPADGRPSPADLQPSDLLHWQTTLLVEGLDDMVRSLVDRGAVMLSDGVVAWPDGARSCLLRDPDGHALRLVERPAR